MNKSFLHILLSLCILCFSQLSLSNDIASSVRDGRTPETQRGGSFEIGIAGGFFHIPHIPSQEEFNDWGFDIDIAGEYRINNFFVEASQGTQDGFNLGYTFWHNTDWSIDFLAASIMGSAEELYAEDKVSIDDPDFLKNKRLEKQDTLYMGTGFRVTRYFHDYVIQYRFVTDTYENNGLISTLRLGRGWQVRNSHFSAIASVQYTSGKTNDYWYGVQSFEETPRYTEFHAKSSISYSLLLNLTKPLSEKWVFRAYFGYMTFPDDIKASPLMEGHDSSVSALSFNYVFF